MRRSDEIVYLTRVELCSVVTDRIRRFAIKGFVDCFSLQAVVHSLGRGRGMFSSITYLLSLDRFVDLLPAKRIE